MSSTLVRSSLSTPAIARSFHTTCSYKHLETMNHHGVDFFRSLNYSGSRENTALNWYRSPKQISRCLEVEAALNERGYKTFYHAAPAASSLLTRVSELTYSKGPLRPHFKFLRPPTEEFTLSRQESFDKIPPPGGAQTKRESLLSVSYSLTSGVRPRESAASFAFTNHFGSEAYFPIVEEYIKLLDANQIPKDSPGYGHLKSKGLSWIQEACTRKIGDIYIIGMKNLSNVYDSAPYNVPTGRNVADVIEHPEKHVDTLLNQGTLMATIVMNEDMNPNEDILIVKATDPNDVASLKIETPSPSFERDPFLRDIVSPVATPFEENEMELRARS